MTLDERIEQLASRLMEVQQLALALADENDKRKQTVELLVSENLRRKLEIEKLQKALSMIQMNMAART